MAIQLSVNNIIFDLPTQGESAPWAEGLDGWHEEVTRVLNSLKGASDILETGANISNNVTVPTDVTDLKFNAATVRSFTITGNLTRIYDSSSVYEQFTLQGLKTDVGWELAQDGIGDAGVTFTITPAGQIQYISSNLSYTTTYQGLCKFRGLALLTV